MRDQQTHNYTLSTLQALLLSPANLFTLVQASVSRRMQGVCLDKVLTFKMQ